MGAPNVLLTQQSDRTPAAEPVGNEPLFSTVPATTRVDVGESIKSSVKPEAVKLLTADASPSAAVPLNPQVKLKAAALSTSTPVVEYGVQKEQALGELFEPEQANAATRTTQSDEFAPSNNQTKQYNSQDGHELKPSPLNVVVQKLKALESKTLSESSKVNRSQITPPAAIGMDQRQLVDKSVTVSGVNGAGKVKQRVIDKLLEQKSNRSQDLAELRSEEPNNQKAYTTNQASIAPPVAAKNVPSANDVVPDVPKSSIAQNTNQVTPAPLVGGWKAKLYSSPDDVVLNVEKSPQNNAVVAVPNAPKSAVNEANVANASVAPDYQVRAGDTLTAIAHKHGISLSQLVNANHLTDPDLVQINQQIRIPPFQYSSTAGQQGADYGQQAASSSPEEATLKDQTVFDLEKSEYTPVAAVLPDLRKPGASKANVVNASVAPDYQVKAGDTLTAIAHKHGISLSQLVNANQLNDPNRLQINQHIRIPALASRPTVAVTSEDSQAKAELIAHSLTGGLPLEMPSEPLAKTPLVNAAFSGVGGSISDEVDQLNSPAFGKSQLEPTVLTQPQADPYFQNLQTDIQRLRQKYYAQAIGQVAPMVNETADKAVPIPNQSANQPINPEFRPKQAAETEPRQARPVPAITRARVATVPTYVNPSESLQSVRGRQQVFPELPPLAPGENYLPNPFNTSTPFKGYIWPTRGVLSSGYGWRWGRMHRGIDIAAPIGTPIVASAPGFVVKAGWSRGGYGNLVDIQHADGSFTRYAHNKRILVQMGQEVKQGQQIAEMGNTGFSTGPHSHFEIHPHGKGAVNPIAFLPGRRR